MSTATIRRRTVVLLLALFASCSSPAREQRLPIETTSGPNPYANYQGGPFVGDYQSVEKITLLSGAWFEVGDVFDVVVAALRTLDITYYDRTYHRIHDPVEIPFEQVQQFVRQNRKRMAVWHYDAGDMKFRVVVDYSIGQGRIDRLDVYENAVVRPNGGDVLERKQSESLEVYKRRRNLGE